MNANVYDVQVARRVRQARASARMRSLRALQMSRRCLSLNSHGAGNARKNREPRTVLEPSVSAMENDLARGGRQSPLPQRGARARCEERRESPSPASATIENDDAVSTSTALRGVEAVGGCSMSALIISRWLPELKPAPASDLDHDVRNTPWSSSCVFQHTFMS